MSLTKRRILWGLAGSCIVAGIIFGIWMAFWKSTATGDLHPPGTKLKEPIAQGTDLTITMRDKGFGGGHSLELRLDGRVTGSYVRPPAGGESGMQTIPIEGKIDATRARVLIEQAVSDGALEIHRSREVGMADEPIVALSIRTTVDGVTSERSNWLFWGEMRDKESSFRTTYEALKAVAREFAGEK